MIRDKMLAVFNTKAFYIVFSIVASISLWTYVTYVQNPDQTVTVSNIPVQFVGEEKLQDTGLVVTNVNVENVSIKFSGKHNVVAKLRNDNITLTVDLSKIASLSNGTAGVYQLSYDITYPSGTNTSFLSVASASANFISVTVEKMVSKNIPVKGSYDGGVAEGYQAQPLEFDPETITVSGPEATITQIEYAWVTLKRENLSETVQEAVSFVLMDSEGNEIEKDSSIVTDTDTVLVTLPIVMVKEVALTVNLTYSNTATAANTKCTITPPSITLSGDTEILSEINQIVLATIDLTDFSSTMTEEYTIPIPNGVTSVTGETTAKVTVEVLGMYTKRLSASNIQVKNETPGYETTIITQSLDVTLRGPEEDVNSVVASNIRIVADLAELGNTTGTFSVPAKIYIDGFMNVDAIGDYKISVIVS